jgi:hypothetical protein
MVTTVNPRRRTPSDRRDSPIESVELKISFRPDKATWTRVKEAVPLAVLRNGACEIKIEGNHPAEVEERARVVLEKLRFVVEHRSR